MSRPSAVDLAVEEIIAIHGMDAVLLALAQMNVRHCVIDPRIQFLEDECPGHVASKRDPKVCGRCGLHVDALRCWD